MGLLGQRTHIFKMLINITNCLSKKLGLFTLLLIASDNFLLFVLLPSLAEVILFCGGGCFCVLCAPSLCVYALLCVCVPVCVCSFILMPFSKNSVTVMLSPLFYIQYFSISLLFYWPRVHLSSIFWYTAFSHPHTKGAKNSCTCRSIFIEPLFLAPCGNHFSFN